MKQFYLSGLGALLAAAVATGAARAETLSIGSGDGSLSVIVNAGGDSQHGIYDPIGAIGAANTIFDSYIAISDFTGGGSGFLKLSDFVSSFSSISDTQAISSFAIGSVDFTLTQTVSQNTDFDTGAITGATLNQSLSMTNTGADGASLALRRYFDGDLDFDGSLLDGGGVIDLGGNRVLFETETLDGGGDGGGDFDLPTVTASIGEAEVQPTFVGVNAIGGTVPAGSGYEIADCCELDGRFLAGDPLTNTVHNDDDGDGFIDTPFDVTLALHNDYSIAAGATATYVSQTIFGNSVPPVPGGTEEFPLLPGSTGGPAGDSFVFELPPGSIAERQTVFIDPAVATGYTYTVTGGSAEFFSVTAPSFGAVPDADGYVLTVGATSVSLASGSTVLFSSFVAGSVFSFTITGIDPVLALLPADPLAFVTGVSLINIPSAEPVIITQTPLTSDVPIPLPAAMLLSGIVVLAGAARRRRAA